MMLTLTWKELREHQSIWLTMVILTVVLGTGLARVVAAGDPGLALAVAALTILGLSAAYGVVCGSMMYAGEHEGGTLAFLDIFLGNRGLLWIGKFAVGSILVLTQALAVALVMRLLGQESPRWIMGLVGDPLGHAVPGHVLHADGNAWFLILPVVALEAYAWGLLGSSVTQRVLAGATVAAVGATPVWLAAIVAPPQVFLVLRLVAAGVILAFSYWSFLNQSQDPTLESPEPDAPPDPKKRFFEVWKEEPVNGNERPGHDGLEADDLDDLIARVASEHVPAPLIETTPKQRTPVEKPSSLRELEQAKSPAEVLRWLTLEQAWTPLCGIAIASLLAGLLLSVNVQVLWPLATLLLGVACGTAAFAPEQRDLSYEFLAAQHFPLRMIWRFKLSFWLIVAVLAALLILFVHLGSVAMRQRPISANDGFDGPLPRLLGPTLFFGVWLVYGFAAGQLFVWLCRKSILALLVSFLAALGAIGLWLPSLVCGGASGWQLWTAPLATLLATGMLMRAWAGGRIKEGKPLAALIGFGAAVTLWAFVHFGVRAWELPDVGAPVDPIEFRASLARGNDNAAGLAIQQAVADFEAGGEAKAHWPPAIERAARLPVGIIERPRADGQASLLKHLPTCRSMTDELLKMARTKEPDRAFEHVAQILALSRSLRNKAPVESYLAGVQTEERALTGLDEWLARSKPDPKRLRRVLDELNRHADETPPPLDCLQTECFRAGGLLANPNGWTLAAPGAERRIRERWLTGGIATSLEVPWEAERKTRIWQLVWAGLFRGVETPYWKLPAASEELHTNKNATQKILQAWLPAESGMTRADMAQLVDASWLADERLFCDVTSLRDAAIRARWRAEATRLAVALSLYRIDESKPAPDLQALVPKYVPSLPADPYGGQSFRYHSGRENQAIIWSTGPDRIDHGGRNHGGHLADTDPQWADGELDLVLATPQWP